MTYRDEAEDGDAQRPHVDGRRAVAAAREDLGRAVALGADLVVEEGALLEATSSVGLAGHPYLVGVKVESGEGEG